MTPDQSAAYEAFCETYERVRTEEGWGGEDLDLPFGPLGHSDIWAVRQQTFKRLDKLLQAECGAAGTALDVGAGNCWLTRHLDHWGFEATALDVNDGPQDGLRAGGGYIECGDSFERIRAPMEALPFLDSVFDLLVASASLHYFQDLSATLGEFARVLKTGGLIVVMDSPWYERQIDGKRSLAQNVRGLIDAHGISEEMARRSSFLYRGAFDTAMLENSLEYRRVSVWPGRKRALETLHARFYERRIASFPLLVIRKRSGVGAGLAD
jgi:SAM-dependent methyltransferase